MRVQAPEIILAMDRAQRGARPRPRPHSDSGVWRRQEPRLLFFAGWDFKGFHSIPLLFYSHSFWNTLPFGTSPLPPCAPLPICPTHLPQPGLLWLSQPGPQSPCKHVSNPPASPGPSPQGHTGFVMTPHQPCRPRWRGESWSSRFSGSGPDGPACRSLAVWLGVSD